MRDREEKEAATNLLCRAYAPSSLRIRTAQVFLFCLAWDESQWIVESQFDLAYIITESLYLESR